MRVHHAPRAVGYTVVVARLIREDLEGEIGRHGGLVGNLARKLAERDVVVTPSCLEMIEADYPQGQATLRQMKTLLSATIPNHRSFLRLD